MEVLRSALKEAEDELCQVGHELVNQGWETGTIAKTLDVLRIALYGSDGAGNGLDEFENSRVVLHEMRAKEAAAAA